MNENQWRNRNDRIGRAEGPGPARYRGDDDRDPGDDRGRYQYGSYNYGQQSSDWPDDQRIIQEWGPVPGREDEPGRGRSWGSGLVDRGDRNERRSNDRGMSHDWDRSRRSMSHDWDRSSERDRGFDRNRYVGLDYDSRGDQFWSSNRTGDRMGDRTGSRFDIRNLNDRDFGGRGFDTVRRDEQGSHSGKGPKGYQRSDERIREDVSEALTHDPHVDASDVEVTVSEGVVRLFGTVEDRKMKRKAEDVVEHCRGVRDVQNDLKLRVANFWDKLTGQEAPGPMKSENRLQ